MKKKEMDVLSALDEGLKSDDELAIDQLVKTKRESDAREKFVSQFLDGQPFDETRFWNEYDFFNENSALAYIEAGKRLVVLKHMAEHGNFMEALAERGITQWTANRQMAVSIKFANSATLLNLKKSKLIELTQLTDEEVETLNSDGVALGKTLDELETMSVRELQELVRKSKAKIEKRDAELDKMRKENERLSDRVSERDHAKEIGKMDINIDYLRLADAFNAFIKTAHNTNMDELENAKFTFGRALTSLYNDAMDVLGVRPEVTMRVAGRNFRPPTEAELEDDKYMEAEKQNMTHFDKPN